MKKILYIAGTLLLVFAISGCSTKNVSVLDKEVAKESYKNYFDKKFYTVVLPEDTESFLFYLPKDDMNVRLKLKISNLEDIVYIKIVDDSPFNIDKILRGVSDIEKLGYRQDGYMFEPSVEKDIVTVSLYIPSVYLYDSKYRPKLVYAYKRDGRVLVDSIQLNFVKKRYFVEKKGTREDPKYTNIEGYCKENKIEKRYFDELGEINKDRIDEEFIKELEKLCAD